MRSLLVKWDFIESIFWHSKLSYFKFRSLWFFSCLFLWFLHGRMQPVFTKCCICSKCIISTCKNYVFMWVWLTAMVSVAEKMSENIHFQVKICSDIICTLLIGQEALLLHVYWPVGFVWVIILLLHMRSYHRTGLINGKIASFGRSFWNYLRTFHGVLCLFGIKICCTQSGVARNNNCCPSFGPIYKYMLW